jgi:putative membrane protein
MPRNVRAIRQTYDEAFHDTPIDIRDYALSHRDGELWKGALAGAIAGLASGWVMVQFQNAWSAAERKITQGDHTPKHREEQGGEQEDATIKAARRVSEGVFRHELNEREKKVAGPAVHYAFSAAMGALYGVATEVAPQSAAAFGTVFGSALFVGADEVAVPALGLSDKPQDVPVSKHIYGLVSHWVWGASTEVIRRGVRSALR